MLWNNLELPPAYYQDDAVYIIHGDCREILPLIPDKSIDLVLTDPPYGIGQDGGHLRARKWQNVKVLPRLSHWDNQRPEKNIFDHLLRISINQIIWGGNYFTDYLPVSRGWLYWQKLMGGDFSDGELAWSNRDGVLKEYTKCPKGQNNNHPTQKPSAVISWCLSFYPEVQLILDPFLGSGTTAYCAKKLNRKCIGIEIEEKYCEIAAKRCSQSVMRLDI